MTKGEFKELRERFAPEFDLPYGWSLTDVLLLSVLEKLVAIRDMLESVQEDVDYIEQRVSKM